MRGRLERGSLGSPTAPKFHTIRNSAGGSNKRGICSHHPALCSVSRQRSSRIVRACASAALGSGSASTPSLRSPKGMAANLCKFRFRQHIWPQRPLQQQGVSRRRRSIAAEASGAQGENTANRSEPDCSQSEIGSNAQGIADPQQQVIPRSVYSPSI